MPLVQGKGRKAISTNIRRMVNEGRPQRQAVAISMDVARRGRKRKKGTRT